MSRISLNELESYLGKSADILWGVVPPERYKEFIIPLLFFKRISDIFDEIFENRLKESGGDEEYAKLDYHYSFVIPEGSHWNDVRGLTEDIGKGISDALKSIENSNIEKLSGVFGNLTGWTDKELLPDRVLMQLIEHFSTKKLTLDVCPEDEFGQGYEYLIKRFADDAGHTAQEFYTNRTVVHLMTEILKPDSGESVYDPTCGTGGMLISCIAYLKQHEKEWRNVKVFGQETIPFTASIARMNLFLHGVTDFSIECDDTLVNPKFIENGKLQKFDIVLANPPYSIKDWNREAFTYDKYGRNMFGTPPQGRADYAFIQHIFASMKADSGRCAILLPHGVLFREEEKHIRENLIKSDLLECVIGLAPNLFYNATMEACIMICRTNKPANKKNRVLFINAIDEVTRRNAQSNLEETHIKKTADAYNAFTDIEGFAKVATYEDIVKQDYNLNISRYVEVDTVDEDPVSFSEHKRNWLEHSYNAKHEVNQLINMLGGDES